MDIEVGSKWKDEEGDVFTVLCVGKKNAFIDTGEFGETLCTLDYFEDCTPYIEFEWQKFDKLEKFYKGEFIWNIKDNIKSYELLHNYNLYWNKFDNFDFGEVVYVYSICQQDNSIGYFYPKERSIGEMVFSSKEHAKTFLQLAKENDCL